LQLSTLCVGIPASVHSRLRGRFGANAWTDVEGVATNGLHWPSAVRYLPDKDPLRDAFAQEFVGMDSLRLIARAKPPKPSNTEIAVRIAKDDTIPLSDKRYLCTSAFHGEPCIHACVDVEI
jgi:hypothetical protein